MAALGLWLETARWWYRRLICVNGKTITPDGIIFFERGGLCTMLINKGQGVMVTLLERLQRLLSDLSDGEMANTYFIISGVC